ncbi:MAG: FG-GAP repeat domain-containing protein [Candidatus Angelobacter sp.]
MLQAATRFQASSTRWQWADFSGDGKLDVIVLRLNDFEVFKGNGDGTFATPTSTSVAGSFGLTYGSFNNTDRSLDIALANNAPNCSAPPCINNILDYLNNGTGALSLRSKTQMFGSHLAAVDVNGDLITDIVGLNTGHFDGNLQYVQGDGHGIFSAANQIASPDSGAIVVARDMNLDGRHDLIIPEDLPSDVLLEINNNAAVTCTPPGSGSLHAKFCAPAAGASVTRTFTVKGSGNSPAGVVRIELWVDGKKNTEMWNDQISASVTVAAGSHRVALVAVDKYGANSTSAINVSAH